MLYFSSAGSHAVMSLPKWASSLTTLLDRLAKWGSAKRTMVSIPDKL